jgi:hypothetical protein
MTRNDDLKELQTTALSTGIPEGRWEATTSAASVQIAPVVKMYALTVDLPAPLLLGISKVAVHWAVEEWHLQQVLFALTTGDAKSGRVSIGFPRAENAVERIEQLCDLKGINVASNLKSLKVEAKRLEKLRDEVGHGVWIIDELGRYCVVVYAGNWGPGNEFAGTAKRITPHAKPIDAAALEATVNDISALIALTASLANEVDAALGALRGKSA